MSENINIANLSKVAVFRALYNNARVQGLGVLHATDEDMTLEQAAEEFGDGVFDYHRGRVMKVDLRGDELRVRAYDRDNGEGAARRALYDLLPQEAASER